MKFNLLKKIARRILRDEILSMTIPKPEVVVLPPEGFKRYHTQRIIPYYEWNAAQRFEPDCFIKTFKFDIVNELLNEIIIKAEEVPDGIKYSCDLLMENI